jgi:hypothetical protein
VVEFFCTGTLVVSSGPEIVLLGGAKYSSVSCVGRLWLMRDSPPSSVAGAERYLAPEDVLIGRDAQGGGVGDDVYRAQPGVVGTVAAAGREGAENQGDGGEPCDELAHVHSGNGIVPHPAGRSGRPIL